MIISQLFLSISSVFPGAAKAADDRAESRRNPESTHPECVPENSILIIAHNPTDCKQNAEIC
jgi:hypothetical protein